MVQVGHGTQPNLGWLAVVTILALGYTSEPSVPRFNSRVVISETGGGYRRYSQLVKIYYKCIDLEYPSRVWYQVDTKRGDI